MSETNVSATEQWLGYQLSLRWTIRFLRNIKDALEIAFGRIPGYFTSAFKIKEHPDHTIGHMTTEVSEKKQDKVPHVHHTRGGHKKHDKVPAFDHAGHVTVESNGNLGHGKQDEVPTHVLVQEWKDRLPAEHALAALRDVITSQSYLIERLIAENESLRNEIKTQKEHDDNQSSMMTWLDGENRMLLSENENLKQGIRKESTGSPSKTCTSQKTVSFYTARGSGNFCGCDLDFVQKLTELLHGSRGVRVHVTEWSADCPRRDPVLLFCLCKSRVGSDIQEALSSVAGSRQVVLVLMRSVAPHKNRSTGATRYATSVPVSQRSRVALELDVVIWPHDGLYKCPTNDSALDNIAHFLMTSDAVFQS